MAYIDVLEKWNLWKGDIETGVKRHSYVERALKFLEPNVILAIIGVRRSGKSFIMRQIAKELVKNGYD
ncbi:MAG: ATP-binding protein, partial [Candidatus Aenigmarchaeota archaeon]|nr:ATP-binding protein [Candidatus Aenigmarchaeota archaeon]